MGVGGGVDMDALKRPWVWVCVFAALLVRIPAVSTLPIDWDEPIYMESAQALLDAFQAGAWSEVFSPIVNPEHPGLVKTIYALGFSFFGSDIDPIERLIVVRGLSPCGLHRCCGSGNPGRSGW